MDVDVTMASPKNQIYITSTERNGGGVACTAEDLKCHKQQPLCTEDNVKLVAHEFISMKDVKPLWKLSLNRSQNSAPH